MSEAALKRELRRAIIAARDALPPDRRRELSAAICRRVAASPEFARRRFALLFASFGSEVDTGDLLRIALAEGKRVALPRVEPATRTLELREVRSLEDDLAPGLWSIPEPIPERCPLVSPDELDFVLVPGVAFDRERRRLGYGGGYYDRLLSALPPGTAAIAVCFGLQIVPTVPAAEHDRHVPVIITESERVE